MENNKIAISPISKINPYAWTHNLPTISELVLETEITYLKKKYIVKQVDRKGFWVRAFLVNKNEKVSEKKFVHISSNVIEEKTKR